jgi:hypothetical protein
MVDWIDIRLSPIGVAKRVGKFKMATLGYCSGKNTASTELLNRVVKMTVERVAKMGSCFDFVKIVLWLCEVDLMALKTVPSMHIDLILATLSILATVVKGYFVN